LALHVAPARDRRQARRARARRLPRAGRPAHQGPRRARLPQGRPGADHEPPRAPARRPAHALADPDG
jgi:hypothetical protein